MEKITVTLGKRSYPIRIAKGLLKNPNAFFPLKFGDKAMLVTNQTLSILYLDNVKKILKNAGIIIDYVLIPDGEQYKTLSVMESIFTALLSKNHGRDTTLIALGGGVIGDITGFAAASYQRGVRFIQVPTTLLSQVDSSVGGKTAVNHPLGKNMIGTFYQPSSVVIDLNCLTTLPAREFSSGLAEVIKYSIIFDRNFFTWLENHLDALLALDINALSYCIRRCCELKAEVIATDEYDIGGMRTLLNLGHTYGHAIEVHMGYGTWSHGEAIAVGIVMAAKYSEKIKHISKEDTNRIIMLFQRAGLPTYGPPNMNAEDYLPHMMRDKKTIANTLSLVLPVSIGKAIICNDVSHNVLLQSIQDCLTL